MALWMATCFNNNPSRVDWRWTKIEMWEGKETHLAQARKFTAIKSIRMIKNTILMIRWTFTILQHTRKWSFLKFIYIFFVILRVMWRIISSYMAWGFVCFERIFLFWWFLIWRLYLFQFNIYLHYSEKFNVQQTR